MVKLLEIRNKFQTFHSFRGNPCPYVFSTNPCECSKTHIVSEMGTLHRDFWRFYKVWSMINKLWKLQNFAFMIFWNTFMKKCFPHMHHTINWFLVICYCIDVLKFPYAKIHWSYPMQESENISRNQSIAG